MENKKRMKMKMKITVLCIIVFVSIFCHCVQGEEGEKKVNKAAERMDVMTEQRRNHPIVEIAMKLLSVPTAFPDTSGYWTKMDSLIKQGRSFFSSPNLDFRGGETKTNAGEEGTGEKVKEAVMKSVDKSKETIKDSAKLAAEAVNKASKKFKGAIPENDQEPTLETEL